eukprot:19950-Hanusia_phi.AAC.1
MMPSSYQIRGRLVVAHRVSRRSGTRWASASLPGPRPSDPHGEPIRRPDIRSVTPPGYGTGVTESPGLSRRSGHPSVPRGRR